MSPSTRYLDVVPTFATSVWPSAGQLQLLRAALWTGKEAGEAWQAWQRQVNLRALDGASWHLLPLVWRNLHSHGFSDPILTECRGFHHYHWARNHQKLRQAAPWIRGLQDRGIPLVVLKGAVLAATIYPDPGTRPMSDIDVMVPLDRILEVVNWLQTEGWQPLDPETPWHSSLLAIRPGYNWRRGEEGLDLHWHVLHSCPLPEKTRLFWDRVEPCTLYGIKAQQLCLEDMLLHVGCHGLRWQPEPAFRWLADLAWILRRAEGRSFDWGRVLAMAEAMEAEVLLRAGFAYAAEELKLPVPASVLGKLRRRRMTLREHWKLMRTTELNSDRPLVRAYIIAGLLLSEGSTGSVAERWRRMRDYLHRRWQVPGGSSLLREFVRRVVRRFRGAPAGPAGQNL